MAALYLYESLNREGVTMNQSAAESRERLPGLDRISDILSCPQCRGGMTVHKDHISCNACAVNYPVIEGVPMLARMGSSDSWQEGTTPIATSEDYQQRYQDINEAADYNAAYKRKLFKRMSTNREFHLLQKLLGSQEHCRTILDLPCGGGRLSPQIAPHTDLLIEADIAEGQVLYGSRNVSLPTPQIWMTASAFHIPFSDASIDAVVSCRLCHHLPTADERDRLVCELLRVAKKFVIMTFFDHYSPKNILRQVRRPFNHLPPKMTMTINRVRELAQQNGARLVEYPCLAWLSSGHRYALMIKDK